MMSAPVSAALSIFNEGYDCTITADEVVGSDKYRVYVGQSTVMMQPAVDGDEPSFKCSAAGVIDPGQYYIAMTALKVGVESVLSSYVIAVIGDDKACGKFISGAGGEVELCVTNKYGQDYYKSIILYKNKSILERTSRAVP
jgi:hypothetical protein